MVKIDEYIGFCVHRRSYLLGSPVIIGGFSTCLKNKISSCYVSRLFIMVFDVFSLFPVVSYGNQQFQNRYSSCLVEPDIELHDRPRLG